MLLGGILSCTLTSVILFLFSYLIWSKKELSLISGYNEKTFKGDKNKLAKAVGLFLIINGVLVFILPFGLEFIGSIAGAIITIIALGLYMKFINKK
ncbi:DUF3784 domain-containing protein [Metabacillus fastidiosus]|uniref:DUF3784 domain-containing protein n=1 Tax=Metabacillus fastidiosus TaxID=1458 RepID=UPI002DB9F4ED|nr:DUF3784 domain-containing protein [Metabacillus fastidiosus]MEC2076356.1 DUF3784 domain-containing protein [Metabacillus fastidiosus]